MMEIFRQTKAYQLVDGDLRQGRLSHAYLLLLPDAGSPGGCLRVSLWHVKVPFIRTK